VTAATHSEADPGLFGPDSVTWRVHRDPVLWVGGIRALLLQALHPLAMAGVAQHSSFREDPWGRLVRTGDFVGVTTFGTTSEARRAAARVRGIHRRVRGTEPETGQRYAADDPALLAWVHCCEIESFLSTARRSGVAISAADADRYVAEQTRIGPLVGVDPDELPASVRELAAYFDEVRPQLRLTAASRSAALFMLAPPLPRAVALATPARPAWAGVATLGFALLPRWARRLYRLPGLPTTDVGATATVRALRLGLLALPLTAREGPHLRDAKERLGLA
jgi:uncharacterized protein (DUF2236 family)